MLKVFRRPAVKARKGIRRRGPKTPIFSTAVALAVAILILLDFLTDIPFFTVVGTLLVEYGLIIAVFALFLGLLNVVRVHNTKFREREEGWFYSLILLVTTISLTVAGIIGGPQSELVSWSFENVLLPLQSAFFSLLAFFLVTVAYRALRVNSFENLLFVGSAVLVILGTTPVATFFGQPLVEAKDYLLAVPAAAGARGLLLGIALGTIATGLRLIVDGRRYFK